MEGADIYVIAKNYRTSVEVVEKFYAAHIKNEIDAAAVNVSRGPAGRPRPAFSSVGLMEAAIRRIAARGQRVWRPLICIIWPLQRLVALFSAKCLENRAGATTLFLDKSNIRCYI